MNEALAAYIDTHRWQIKHIQRGLREADAEKFPTATEVRTAIRRLRPK